MNEATSIIKALPLDIPGFEIACPVAEGGMATVYRATQTSLNRTVALKILRRFEDPEHQQRFINESRMIASLTHRSVITIHDVGDINGRPFLAMEYCEEGDLATRIASGAIDPCDALEITANIGDCLAFVHGEGIVHRDIKPANILFGKGGTPVLADFGIATDVKVDQQLTTHGTTVGSPCYLSPEQAEGKATDGRTDVYSLGVVLYEMLVGQPPFRENSAIETMAAHINLPPPRLPETLQPYQPLLDRMLAKQVNERFATAAEMVDWIRDAQVNHAGTVTQPLPWRTDWLQALYTQLLESRRQVLAVTSVIVVSLGVWGTMNVLSEPDPVALYMQQAEEALKEDRLAYPRAGSAYEYYRQVLALDSENDDAINGLHAIAEIFANRAETDLFKSNFSSAKFHIDRGLKVQPDNERLLTLREDAKSLRNLPEKVVSGLKSIFDKR